MKTVLRVGGGALLAVAFLLTAALAPGHTPADPLGFGIQAVGHRSYFVFETPAGRTVRGALRIQSTSDRVRTVFLRPASAATAATGGLDYALRGPRPAAGAASWIRLERSKVTLPARSTVEVAFTARIPAGVADGDHLAGIVAFGVRPRARASGDRRFRLRFVSRLAVAVQFRVPGRLVRRLEVRGASIRVSPAGAALGLELASTGNALVTQTTGAVQILQHGRELTGEPVEIGAFVPGTAIAFPVTWPGRPAEGSYEIRGTLRPEGGAPVRIARTVEFGAGGIERFRRQTGRSAVESGGPSVVLIVVALVGAALTGLAAGRLRLRRLEAEL